jgi:exonuclease III
MDIKQKWNVAFKNHLRDLDSRKPVIWGGDLNCILQQNGELWGL